MASSACFPWALAMRDPFNWSFPLPLRLYGITVRVHLLFPLFVLTMWLRVATNDKLPANSGLAMLILMGLAFFAVLLHELGHCFAAWRVEGDAREVLLWPLGGLASCDIPQTPRAHFITAAGGPAANVILCLVCAGILACSSLMPPLEPTWDQAWNTRLYNWSDGQVYGGPFAEANLPRLEYWQHLVAQLFWVSWFQFLLNVLLLGFPLDGGRLLHAALWPRFGYRHSLLGAIWTGFGVTLVVGVFALVINELLLLLLAGFIFISCKQEWVQLETGGEDSLFGYDFSQGYTSLERSQQQHEPAAPPRKKQNFIQRWLARRAAKKLQREQEQAEADERRMDELLQKIQDHGKDSLTDEEQRFLKRVSDRYRNRP